MRAAVEHVTRKAQALESAARETLNNIESMSGLEHGRLETLMRLCLACSPIALHFHPDRLVEGKSVLTHLVEQGEYKSQFETRVSNGLLSPEPGGARDKWENRLFGDVYHQTHNRPKYGALDLWPSPDGPAPRFGSCYFLLNPEVNKNASFCYLDSHKSPTEVGTLDCFAPVWAALFADCFEREAVLGRKAIRPPGLVEALEQSAGMRFKQQAARNLDLYIEAQVHQRVLLSTDVQGVVADPSYRNSGIGTQLENLAVQYNIPLYWHCGFSLTPQQIPLDFRGPGMPELARHLAIGNKVTALALGVEDMFLAPEKAHERQQLKRLWHVLVRFGAAYEADATLVPFPATGSEHA